MQRLVRSARVLAIFCGASLPLVAGCGGPSVVPVSGVATVDGKPLEGFVVTFVPDAAKGHNIEMDCSAKLGKEGQYSLSTDDRYDQYKGAPPGWYKVVIWSNDDKPIPVNQKFQSAHTTELAVEVVADPAPGAYDLKFTK